VAICATLGAPTRNSVFVTFVMPITSLSGWLCTKCQRGRNAMDPDFFEVVMGSDGRLRFVPVTEQAHAEVTISSEKRAREASRDGAVAEE
jgi:hypothetical protein